jgi:hypothetical protein
MMMKKTKSIALSTANPFTDSQARSYSDKRVLTEFYPISKFWTLFNSQHEILIGTRGCGKTVLLKMMRYSMLNKLPNSEAKDLISRKEYVAFYVPLHLEYIKKLSNSNLSIELKINWFRFAFNCALALSIIIEITALLKDLLPNELDRSKTEYSLTKAIHQHWMLENNSPVFQLSKLRETVIALFYRTDPLKADLSAVPHTFTHSLGSPLSSISSIIGEKLCISPTWIVCVDEAEFLDECYQKCINTVFRSDTDRIVFKIATLPFYHTTKHTLNECIDVMNGQDFKYTIVDMDCESPDFINVTNSLIQSRFRSENINNIEQLEDFIETVGDDHYIDYYYKEFNRQRLPRKCLEENILSQLSASSRAHNQKKTASEIRKTVFDKLAPIFYVREMFKITSGRTIAGWYAGASMIRRVSQGNPRIFIRIMDKLYNEAKGKKLPLTVKKQSKVMIDFAKSFCKETETLEQSGHEAKKYLEHISQRIHDQVHKKDLVQSGVSFKLANISVYNKNKWIERSIAFSRLMVDDNSLTTQITADSTFQLANVYAVRYWLPMRIHASPLKINLKKNKPMGSRSEYVQLSLFSKGDSTDDY